MLTKYKNGKPWVNLLLNKLRLIAEHRNINNHENRSAKDLIKALFPRFGIKKVKRN